VTPRATPDSPIRWGEPPRGGSLGASFSALVSRVRAALGDRPRPPRESLPNLPLALRRGELAQRYLAAENTADHPAAGAAASTATEQAISEREWWPADIWGHRALWHFERAGMDLEATRAARRIGDVRAGGGDPASSRRYYAEAISEARDIGAEREEGLAALRALTAEKAVLQANDEAGSLGDLIARNALLTESLLDTLTSLVPPLGPVVRPGTPAPTAPALQDLIDDLDDLGVAGP